MQGHLSDVFLELAARFVPDVIFTIVQDNDAAVNDSVAAATC